MGARVGAALRFARVELGIVLAYAIAHAAFGALSADDGLITPDGSVSAGVLVVGALAVILRLVALFVAPAALAARAAYALVARR